jgi:hypothetical protein
MPFIYDHTQDVWPDEETEPPPPRADQFVYIAAAAFGGGRAPVRYEVPSLQPSDQATAAEQPSQSHAAASAQPSQAKNGGAWSFLHRLMGLPPPAGALSPIQREDQKRRERARSEWERQWERTRAVVIPALQQIGGRRIYGRYDGGNDEGFAWFDSLALKDGQRIDLDAVVERLHDAQVHASLRAAGVELEDPFSPTASDSQIERAVLKSSIDRLCDDWATMLLGRGFGTGEYSMYGAFTVDLEACTIADDPGAEAVVQNISISR